MNAGEGTPRMNELLSSGLWPRIRKLAEKAKRKSAAVAYVTDDRYLKFKEGDILVTDASDEAIKTGQTSVSVLKAALKRKATIASIPGLHAKVYVFDNKAVIGSANLSRESEHRTEVALITDQPAIVSSSLLLIDEFRAYGDVVDKTFVSRISRLPVNKRRSLGRSKRAKTVDPSPRSWLVGLKPVQENEEEQAFVDEGMVEAEMNVSQDDSSVSWIRFRGNSRFRREAKKGDVVICIWSKSHKTKPKAVYRHSPILLRRDGEENDVTWFYVEDFPDAEEAAITWRQFQKLYDQIGLPGKLSQWPSRELARHHSDALHDLWPHQG